MSPHDDPRPEDRLDRLISASLDGETTPEDRAWLDEQLARDPAARARLEAFGRVDAEVRRLAESAIGEERLASLFASLRSRLEAGSVGSADPPGERFPDRARGVPARSFRVRPWIPALAAAAAMLLYLLLPGPGVDSRRTTPSIETVEVPVDGMTPESVDSDPVPGSNFALDLDLDLEEGLSVVLGYGEDPYAGEEAPIDDLEVIEQLDLLDFLASRETAGRG